MIRASAPYRWGMDGIDGRVRGAVEIMRGTSFAAPYEVHCRDEFSYGLCRIHTVSAVSAS